MKAATKMAESFTCPECGMTSHHPQDVKYGYCGNCHAYTGEDSSVTTLTCPSCGKRNPFHEKDCVALLENRQRMLEEFGPRHPSLQAVELNRSGASAGPSPADEDWNEWAQLFNDLTFAPGLARDPHLLFSKRRELALYLWNLGYRKRVQ